MSSTPEQIKLAGKITELTAPLIELLNSLPKTVTIVISNQRVCVLEAKMDLFFREFPKGPVKNN